MGPRLSAAQESLLDLMAWEFHTVPGVRPHQLWQHAVIQWLHRTQPSERFQGILVAYMEGRPEGIRAFEQASRLMRMDCEQCSHPKSANNYKGLRKLSTDLSTDLSTRST